MIVLCENIDPSLVSPATIPLPLRGGHTLHAALALLALLVVSFSYRDSPHGGPICLGRVHALQPLELSAAAKKMVAGQTTTPEFNLASSRNPQCTFQPFRDFGEKSRRNYYGGT